MRATGIVVELKGLGHGERLKRLEHIGLGLGLGRKQGLNTIIRCPKGYKRWTWEINFK